MTMEQVSYSLRHTVFGILKTLVVRASQNNLELTYDVDSDIPDQLIGDSLRLRQVITNLVGNAIKFTPSKAQRRGHVALSCRLISIEDATVKLEFCVMDTGIGIAKESEKGGAQRERRTRPLASAAGARPSGARGTRRRLFSVARRNMVSPATILTGQSERKGKREKRENKSGIMNELCSTHWGRFA